MKEFHTLQSGHTFRIPSKEYICKELVSTTFSSLIEHFSLFALGSKLRNCLTHQVCRLGIGAQAEPQGGTELGSGSLGESSWFLLTLHQQKLSDFTRKFLEERESTLSNSCQTGVELCKGQQNPREKSKSRLSSELGRS